MRTGLLLFPFLYRAVQKEQYKGRFGYLSNSRVHFIVRFAKSTEWLIKKHLVYRVLKLKHYSIRFGYAVPMAVPGDASKPLTHT